MAVVKTMNATIVTGEYQNAQGETKKSYMTIGTLFIYDNGGMSLKLDALPVGNPNINFYEKKPKQQQQPQQGHQQQPQQYQQQPQQYQQPMQQQAPQPQMQQPMQQQQFPVVDDATGQAIPF